MCRHQDCKTNFVNFFGEENFFYLVHTCALTAAKKTIPKSRNIASTVGLHFTTIQHVPLDADNSPKTSRGRE